MARSDLKTPDSISGQQNIATPFSDLQPAAKTYSVYQTPTTSNVADAQTENRYTQLAGALKDLMPVAVQAVKYQQDIEDERILSAASVAASKAAQDKNIKDIAAAQASGLLPDGASPLYIRAWKANFLKLRGQQGEMEAKQAYYNNPELRNSDDPNAFNAFITDWREKFLRSTLNDPNGVPQYSALEINDSKINEGLQQTFQSLHSEHVNYRVGERERAGRETAQNLSQVSLDRAFSGKQFYEINYEESAQKFQAPWYGETGAVTMGKMRGSNATADMTESLITYAKQTKNPEVLNIANFVRTPGGTLAGTQAFRQAAETARQQIAADQYQAKVREDSSAKIDAAGTLEERSKLYKDQWDQTKNSLYREKYAREQSSKIYLAPAHTMEQKESRNLMIRELYEADPTAAAAVQQTIQKMEEHSDTVRRTKAHDAMEAILMDEIIKHPTAPGIEDRIVATFKADGIDRSQMHTMLSMVDSYRTKANMPNAMKDPIYEHLEKTVYSSSVGDISKVGGMEALEAGRAQFEFRLEALKLIQEQPDLATNGRALAEAMEKRVKPIVERHNKVILGKRKQDEEEVQLEKELTERVKKMRETGDTSDKGAVDYHAGKVKEFQQKLDDFDKGIGPDPRLQSLKEDTQAAPKSGPQLTPAEKKALMPFMPSPTAEREGGDEEGFRRELTKALRKKAGDMTVAQFDAYIEASVNNIFKKKAK